MPYIEKCEGARAYYVATFDDLVDHEMPAYALQHSRSDVEQRLVEAVGVLLAHAPKEMQDAVASAWGYDAVED